MARRGLIALWLLAAPISAQGAALFLDPPNLALGVVPEGMPVMARARIGNASDQPFVITEVVPSCGCTVAKLSSKLVPPAAFVDLDVQVDPFAKRGRVRKTVRIRNDRGEEAVLVISFVVVPAAHPPGKARSIFAGKCARCHAEPARGLADGAAIYQAVCAMCHGEHGKGAYAPPVAGLSEAHVRKVLEEGLGRWMPAFAQEKGGPLAPAQLEALAHWLASLRAK